MEHPTKSIAISNATARFLIVGGCLAHLEAELIAPLCSSYGIEASVRVAWPVQLKDLPESECDVLIYQPSMNWFLHPLWDQGAFLSDVQRGQRLDFLKSQLKQTITDMRKRCMGGLLIVQGFSAPVYSPLGTYEFRFKYNFNRIVSSLNELITDYIQNDMDAMFIDEERLFSSVGKKRIVDDTVSLFSHHGPIGTTAPPEDGSNYEQTFEVVEKNHASKLLARAYVDAFVSWSGTQRIKCVVVDLDDTLWPGECGSPDFDVAVISHHLDFGAYAGIHQALKVIKQQGVLIAACSRNSEQNVSSAFAKLAVLSNERGLSHLLTPNDFAVMAINWRSKVENIRDIATALAIRTDAMLFIDNNFLERHAATLAYPGIRTLGDNLSQVRSFLLSDPCLQVPFRTDESAVRTTMIQAQLRRDAFLRDARGESAFLQDLRITIGIAKVLPGDDTTRIVELLRRTNQFNTTLARCSSSSLQRYLLHPQASTYLLRANDRFASYGLVGVCIIFEAEVHAFAISCRVLPLRLEIPFLTTVIRAHGCFPLRAGICRADSNAPCHDFYLRSGFELVDPDMYELRREESMTSFDASVYDVRWERLDPVNPYE